MLMVSPSCVGVFSCDKYRMSSPFTYTFTKLLSFPSLVYKCLLNSANSAVSLFKASCTVVAENSAAVFPRHALLTALVSPLLRPCSSLLLARSILLLRSDVPRFVLPHIPCDLLSISNWSFRLAHPAPLSRSRSCTTARRAPGRTRWASPDGRDESGTIPRSPVLAPGPRAPPRSRRAAQRRIGFAANRPVDSRAPAPQRFLVPQPPVPSRFGRAAHRSIHAGRFAWHAPVGQPPTARSCELSSRPSSQSSSQNRSLKYLAPESANTVTMTARCPLGTCLATSRQPTKAAAELGLTSIPSSRASRFTIR